MRSFLTKAILGTTLAASALATAVPAEAQYYHRGYYGHRGDSTGAAIAGGVVGLALGAAIASSANRDRYYYRDRGYYYNDPYYRPQYNNYYYAPPPPPPCRVERRWDPYYGRPYNVRVCY